MYYSAMFHQVFKIKTKILFYVYLYVIPSSMITLLFYCVLILFLYILLKLELFGARYNLMFKPWIGSMAES